MAKQLCILLAVMLAFGNPLQAQTTQANTLVVGKISNRVSLEKEIKLMLNMRYMTSETEEYRSNILEDGTFAFGVEVREPQYATIVYSGDKKLVFLQPYDTLSMEFNGRSFPRNVVFGSKAGANNRFLNEYINENPKALNQFKKVQFRKEIFWYSTLPKQDAEMRNTTPEQFSAKLKMERDRGFAKLDFYRKNHPNSLSPDFIRFMETEIMYDWGYNMLMFGHLYKGRYGLTDSYFTFTDELPLNDASIGNHLYRDYVLAFINYQYEKEGKPEDPYVWQYDYAVDRLYGQTQAFVQSEMLYKAFLDESTEKVLGRYWAFVDNTAYLNYEEKVNEAYQKARRYARGTNAPDFSIKDIKGDQIQLAQFGGKVVYLNFWASWCRPCVKKMRAMKPFVRHMEEKGVVFINISLDREIDAWVNAVNDLGFGGIHAMADGDIDSDIAQKYEIKILPQYYIIDKNGAFAERPDRNDINAIHTQLVELTGR